MGAGDERVIRFLERGPARAANAVHPGQVILDGGGRGTIAVAAALLKRMAAGGVIQRSGATVRLAAKPAAEEGVDARKPDPLGAAPRDLGPARACDAALVNHGESPLAGLLRRKAKNGAPFLSEAEFDAGERLRADFSRGALMPRLGANWVASVASGRRHAGGAGVELTDAALGARRRVERALTAVGPELSGVLVDICCFLKGLEQVEAERGWPVRSAKIVLKTALGALVRHYDPRAMQSAGSGVLHWGAADFRPSIKP